MYQGFRYFTLKSRTMPDLGWTQEVVAALMEVVAREVEARHDPKDDKRAAKIDLMMSKPMPKEPKPS